MDVLAHFYMFEPFWPPCIVVMLLNVIYFDAGMAHARELNNTHLET